MLSPKKLLENARNRITKRENWNQGAMATREDRSDVNLSPTDPAAAAWCSIGAIAAEAGLSTTPTGPLTNGTLMHPEHLSADYPYFAEAAAALLDSFTELRGYNTHLYNHNDDASHEEVLAAFDHAIATMRSE